MSEPTEHTPALAGATLSGFFLAAALVVAIAAVVLRYGPAVPLASEAAFAMQGSMVLALLGIGYRIKG